MAWATAPAPTFHAADQVRPATSICRMVGSPGARMAGGGGSTVDEPPWMASGTFRQLRGVWGGGAVIEGAHTVLQVLKCVYRLFFCLH